MRSRRLFLRWRILMLETETILRRYIAILEDQIIALNDYVEFQTKGIKMYQESNKDLTEITDHLINKHYRKGDTKNGKV